MWDIIRGVLISLFIIFLLIGYVIFKIGLGIFDVGKDTVVGTYQTVRHPIETGKNIVHAAKNPKQTLSTLGTSIANDWEEDKLRSVGHFVGNIGLIFIPASKGAQVAEVSKLSVVNKIGTLGKANRLEATAANATFKSIDAGTRIGKEARFVNQIKISRKNGILKGAPQIENNNVLVPSGTSINKLDDVATIGYKLEINGKFSKLQYRDNLKNKTGKLGQGFDAHHTIPKSDEFSDFFIKHNIDVNDPQHLIWRSFESHRTTTIGALKSKEHLKLWREFIDRNRNNPNLTKEQILKQRDLIEKKVWGNIGGDNPLN